MQSSLGVYIENNIIKYAKLLKEKDVVKIENYNVVFYDNDLSETLNRIISETYSYKVPISVNVSNEIYNEFTISTLLSNKDTKKAVNIEYEMLCSEKGYNMSSLEHRYMIVEQKEVAEKQKAISIIANKGDISKKIASFDDKKVNTITPITTSITNLINIGPKENVVIVNIEDKTKITTIVDGQIYKIDVLDEGMGNVLNEINKTENSFSKSYEVCKNMSIYTQNSTELYTDVNEYMDIVMETMDNIVVKTKEILTNLFSNINKVFITGMGTCINNIDLYFQDYISEAKCEILRPYFISETNTQLPVKDYIEVNSAIALALDGLGMINKDINFTKSKMSGGSSRSGSIWTQEISLQTFKDLFSDIGGDFSAPFSVFEKTISRASMLFLMLIVFFIIFSNIISSQIESKKFEVLKSTKEAEIELQKIQSDILTIAARTTTYNSLIDELTQPANDGSMGDSRIVGKDAIPNLLNRIMFVIPKKVKLTSIQNTTDSHIVIEAESEKYEQLGYFKAVLTTNEILKNVKSTSGQKSDTIVKVMIEGDLP